MAAGLTIEPPLELVSHFLGLSDPFSGSQLPIMMALLIVEADILAAMENTQDRYNILFHHKRDACLAAISNDA